MKLLITLCGLVFVLEGLPYLTFPEAMQKWLKELCKMPPGQLRLLGVLAVALGLLLCYVGQRTNWLP